MNLQYFDGTNNLIGFLLCNGFIIVYNCENGLLSIYALKSLNFFNGM